MRKEFHILAYLLIGYLRIDLSGFNIGVSENTANGFYRYSIINSFVSCILGNKIWDSKYNIF